MLSEKDHSINTSKHGENVTSAYATHRIVEMCFKSYQTQLNTEHRILHQAQ